VPNIEWRGDDLEERWSSFETRPLEREVGRRPGSKGILSDAKERSEGGSRNKERRDV